MTQPVPSSPTSHWRHASFATLIVSHGEWRELAGTLLLLVLPLPLVVAEVARLKLPPWHPLSLKGISVEPNLAKTLYVDVFTNESTKKYRYT